jgi:hypothetical protein
MKGKFFKCDYISEGLYVEYDMHCGTEISLFVHDPQNRGWRNRLRLAWACLKGNPYSDMVLLSDEKIADLVDHLIEIQSINHAEENYKETIAQAANKLCGLSCGTAVDAVLEYVKRPDCSKAQIQRLISELKKLQ